MAAPAHIAYLDNNSSSLMPQEVIDAYSRWCNQGCPSAEHASARAGRKEVEGFRREVAVECAFELDKGYSVAFTAGGDEGDRYVLAATVNAYAAKTGRLPHLIVGGAAGAARLYAQRLAADRLCQLTLLTAGLGDVRPASVAAALRPNTCLVFVAAASADTGALCNLRELAAATKARGVPLHASATQLFGRSVLRPQALGVDSFSASFDRMHGPPGVGLLVVRCSLVAGYGLELPPDVANLPGLAAARVAFRRAAADRAAKAARALRLRESIRAGVAARLPCFFLADHPADQPPSIDGGITAPPPAPAGSPQARRAIAEAEEGGPPAVFWVAPADERLTLPNTLLVAVRRPGYSAKAARAALERRGVLVGRLDGAAAAPLALPAALAAGGLLRVSLGDDSEPRDAEAFVRHFVEVAQGEESRLGEN